MKMKFAGPVAWGGSDDDETLLDVLTAISEAAPSVRYTRIPYSTGGWPVFQFECDNSDLEKLADHFSIEVSDLGAVPV
jgi:hypothetical protein